MDDHAWRLEVSEKLGGVVRGVEALTVQVTRQNGNVARLWAEMDKVKQHPGECPLNGRVSQLEIQAAADRAADEAGEKSAQATSSRWSDWVRPAVLMLLTFLLGLMVRGLAPSLKAVIE